MPEDVDSHIVARDGVALRLAASDQVRRRILDINPDRERLLGGTLPGDDQTWLSSRPDDVALNLVTRRVGSIDVNAGFRVARNRITCSGSTDLVIGNVVDPDPDHVPDGRPVDPDPDVVADHCVEAGQ